MNKRELGNVYEDKAVAYLEQHGYQILSRNYRSRLGEIDIIASEGSYLCFIEVKYRSGTAFGTALEAVNAKKQRTIRLVAGRYMQQHGYHDGTPCRFDVVAFDKEAIELIRNAFEG